LQLEIVEKIAKANGKNHIQRNKKGCNKLEGDVWLTCVK
jgi:hypothetical protein